MNSNLFTCWLNKGPEHERVWYEAMSRLIERLKNDFVMISVCRLEMIVHKQNVESQKLKPSF